MRKILSIIVIVAFVVTMGFSAISCKTTTAAETTAAAETTTAAESTAAETTTAAESTAVASGKTLKFQMVIYSTKGNPFWTPIETGANDMSKALGVETNIQYANDDPEKQINIIETAINNKVDGIAFINNIETAYDEVVQKALDAGIPVVGFNIDDTVGENTSPRMAFIGQDFEPAGYTLAKAVIEKGNIKSGGWIVCPVEHPTATYAAQRYAGIKKACDEAGIGSEILDTGSVSIDDVQAKMSQYLLGKPETSAVIGIGGMPTYCVVAAIKDAGMKIPCAGFDLFKDVMQQIIDGEMVGTIDQMPYYQGSLPIYQLWAYDMYGLLPFNVDTSTLKIVDSEMAKKIAPLVETYR